MGCLIKYIVYYMFKKSDQANAQGGFIKKRLVHKHIRKRTARKREGKERKPGVEQHHKDF